MFADIIGADKSNLEGESPWGESTIIPAQTPELPDTDCNNSGFDAASFIGGIVLMGGILAIGFFALKFYQARQEPNYHTL